MMYLLHEIQKVFPKMRAFFTQEQWEKFLACPFDELDIYHFSLGTWVRNHLLTEGSTLETAFRAVDILQKDDMSLLMMQLLYVAYKEKNEE